MPDGTLELAVRIADSLETVPASAWDACALPPEGDGNPFLGHAFLIALERSKSVGRRSGWLPQYLLAETADGTLLGCAPLYVKSHSYGEYVFDHGWADAFERAGGNYYPKLQVAVPFTPAPGPRLLLRPGDAADAVADALCEALVQVTQASRFSSCHVTFCREEEWQRLSGHGFLRRLGQQFHWRNDGYASFDDFLAALNSRKRKAIRKERQAVREAGLTVRALSGNEIEKRHWDAFFAFYMDTGSRKWGQPYLTRSFFDHIGRTMADSIVLVMAEKPDGEPVAGALNLRGRDALYGRNWGCVEDYRFLHFEACYYQAIDYAIAHGLKRVEAGAQGEHKIQRGYLPVPTYSAHFIADPGFRRAVEDFLSRERPMIERQIAGLATLSPFRKPNEGSN
ncbi:MAG: GNAT family N-acetyltransferase [Reyranellaceae bacterium]